MITHWEVALIYIKDGAALAATAAVQRAQPSTFQLFVFNLLEVARQRLCTFGKLASSRVGGDRRHEHPDLNKRAEPSEIAALDVSSGSMLSKNARSVADFAIGGVFGLFPAERWSLIGKHRDRPGKLLTQSPDRLLLLAGRVDAAPLS
jgi:hypothetical protein